MKVLMLSMRSSPKEFPEICIYRRRRRMLAYALALLSALISLLLYARALVWW